MRVVQVGDVAGVAQALTDALGDRVDMTMLPMRQPGAMWPRLMKPLTIPARYLVAERIASTVRNHIPPFEVAHYHWGPNGLAASIRGGNGPQPPWVLHLHGSDIRRSNPITARAVREANAVLYSTPDLAPLIGRDATYLPNPVQRAERGEDVYRVAIASRPDPVKGTAIAEAAVSPDWRAPLPRAEFMERLGQTHVIVGQLVIGALGLVELEAMSRGRPVVCYVRPELYPDPPPVAIAQTAEEVRAAVDWLLGVPDAARQLSEAGQAWVRKHHDPDVVAERLMEVYRAIRPSPSSSC